MEWTDGLSDKLIADLSKAADAVKSSKNAMVISHIDADGITAGSIAVMTLERLGIPYEMHFEKKITEEIISMVNNSDIDIVWICDLGSGYLSEFTRSNIVVTDHHVPDPKFRKKQTLIDGFYQIYHLNPHVYGVDGSSEICGAGMTYLLSRAIDPANTDLAYLGVVGAIGDVQDSRESRLTGYNRIVLRDAMVNGDVFPEDDVRFFGRNSRPLVQFIQYNSDPSIPGISDNRDGSTRFYSSLGIPLKKNGSWRTWNDLSQHEKKTASDKLMDLTLGSGVDMDHLFGEMYTLPNFDPCTGLRDAKEFATVLNSCGRYNDADTGLRLCRGDLSALKDAERNRADHSRNISVALTFIKENHLLRERKFIQYFDSGSEIRETVVGIVAGMLLNSNEVRHELPMFAFATADDGVKVSGRGTRQLVDRGLDLSVIMKKTSEALGGFGGGHNIAAGATIPEDKKEAFLDMAEDLVCSQLT